MSPALPMPWLLFRCSCPPGAPNRDLNPEYPNASPSGQRDCTYSWRCLVLRPSLFPTSKAGFSSLLTLVNPVFVSEASVLSDLGETVKIIALLEDGDAQVTQLVSEKLILLASAAGALFISPRSSPHPRPTNGGSLASHMAAWTPQPGRTGLSTVPETRPEGSPDYQPRQRHPPNCCAYTGSLPEIRLEEARENP